MISRQHTLAETDAVRGRTDEDWFLRKQALCFAPHLSTFCLITPATLAVERLWLAQSNTSAGRVLPKQQSIAALSSSLPYK